MKEIEGVDHDNVTWKKFQLSLRDRETYVSIDGVLVSETWRESITRFYHWWMELLESTGPTIKEKIDAFTIQANALRFSVSWERPYLKVTYLNQGVSQVSAFGWISLEAHEYPLR